MKATRRSFRLWWPLLAAGAILLVAACGPTTVAGPDMPVQDPVFVAAGEPLYATNCAECHGEDLRGTDLGPSHLSIVYEPSHHSDGAFAVAMLVGTAQHHWPYGAMEPVEGLSDEDIISIIAYVREIQRIEGFEAYPPA